MVRLNYWKRVLLIIIVVLIGCAGVLQAKPKNVIFLIGDGMGPEQVKAAGIYAYGAPGTLSFESFPYQGKLTTYSANSSITDSAAAATALATGFKVNNGVISMAYPGNGSELETLLEYYKSLYKSTGLVSTSYLTDATPAAFGAHEPTRSNTSQIAGDYLNQTQPNVLLGGGGNGMTTSEFASAGYTVVTDRASMLALTTESVTKVSGQFGSGQMPYEFDGLGNLPHLSEMTATALSILDNDTDGFFLMVEGGNIDHACHNSDLARTIPEVSEFADAVQVAVNWAAGRNDTLILVAADHETGGLTVTANNGAGVLPGVTWGGAGGHTAANVPVYAWGVNAELISGVMDNTSTFGVVVSDEPIELVNPAYDAVNVPTSPSLEVQVHDPDGTGDLLDVTFFGRENPSFTIVVLPDTQKYVLNGAYPQIFTSQTRWIVDNAVSKNIVFMTHEGDVVDTWNSTTEWGYANNSISVLDGVTPYGLAVGNHDKYENPADPMYDTVSTYVNQTFPYTRYESEPWYGGHYPAAPDPNGNSNNYQLFSAGGDDYIVLHLEDYPTPAVIAWADGVLRANSNRKAIITTHGYMDTGGNYTGKWGSTQYIRDLVVGNDNVYFVLCGHFSGEYAKTTTVNGHLVHEMLADYQDRANGGDGWLRILRFEPDEDKVYVRTYSTWHDAYEADSGSQFTLDFPMTGYVFSVVGTNTGVPSGANTSLTWPDRKMETQHEWYVTVTDATVGTTPGPVWSFTTGSPKAGNPSPADGAADVDTNADLSWSAGVDAVSHDVHFGTDAGNLPLVSAQQAGTTYDPGLLQLDTTYYWAIDEHNSVGGITYGDVWSFTTAPPAPLTFQQGVNGYTGMVDTMIRSPAPTTNYADSAVNYDSGYQYQYNADTSTGSPAGPSHVLLRFDGIIGGGPGQIPVGSTILSATLRLRTMDASNGGKLHRLLQSWTATAVTWNNSFGGNGIQADASEAAVTEDDGVASTSGAGDNDLNVTATVQGYVDGTITNNGWTLLPNGSDGWHIAAAEHPTVDYRPELIVSFTPPQNQPAGNPNPADGVTQAAVDADLSWTAGSGAVSHDVHFGTAQPPAFVQNQTATTFDPGLLLPSTTYYWQIDERDSVGGVTGAVWSFTTAAAPTQAGAPSPVNGATDASINADLTWTAGSGTTSHQVYFGTGSDPRVNTPVNQAESTYDPGILNAATAYYWAVDELGPGGTAAGEVWSFTTAAAPGQANSPTPADAAGDVSATAVLSWMAGTGADTHDVYLGTDEASPPQVSAGQTGTSYDPASLESGTTYYWRVNETGPGGIATGTVWSFTTGYPAPGRAANPNPPSPSSDVSADVVLSWTPGSDTTSHDVYFGTDTDPRVNTPVNQAGAVFDPPGLLQPETTYYWAIDEFGPGGTTSGEVWTFTTRANQAPTANAGVDQAVSDSDGTGSETVTLNGSGSDTDGTIASYEWKEGANVLGNTAAIAPDLAVGVHTITLTVTDNGGATGTDDVIVTVNANQPPTANAGTDQAVSDSDGTGSETVTLNGSGSDTDGTIASYEWKEGANVLGDTATIAPDLAIGVHTITLTVTDNGGATGTDDVIVTVNANQAPAANAGVDQAVSDSDGTGSETVTLNGSGSDTDGTIASYEWKEGANVLGDTATIAPNFAVGVHTITLTVTDNGGTTGSDDVIVTVNANQPPTADAGTDQTVTDNDYSGSESVTLSGSGSDADGTIAAYEWKEGTTPLGNGPSISVDLAVGVHTITLTVTDNGGATGSDNVIVTVEEGPSAIDDTANSDIIVSGTITSGSYVSTAGSDNVYEAIREIRQGSASTGKSLLEHKWTINVTGGSAVSFHVEAYRTANSEGDNFVFAYSTDNVTYTNLLTVTKTADDNTAQSAALPSSLSGTVYVRVQDTDRTKGRTSLDTIYIDQMFIRSQGLGPDTSPPSPNPMTWGVAPYAASSTSVSMTATTASDPSGVEYYFDCLTASGHDSGWQAGTTYTDTGLTPGIEYTYQVKARDKSPNLNETAFSSPASATPLDVPPAAPAGLTASRGDGQVSLDWNDNGESDLAGYNVYRSTTPGAGYVKVNGTLLAGSNYLDSGLTNGTTYYYVVTAVDTGSNQSGYSSEVSATPSSASAVFVTSIVKRPFVLAGKSVKAVAGVTISAPRTGGIISGDWYFKGALVQTGATGTTNAAGYTEIVSPPARASAGDVFRFVVTNVVLSGYTYDPGQNVVSEILITYP